MHNIIQGAGAEETLLVTSAVTIDFLGSEGARVLSTPHMIGYMERTCRNLALPMLQAGHDTVGTHVDVRHLAAAPLGANIRFAAKIVGVSDRRIQFRVEAWNGAEKIGEGTHERAIIDVGRFTERVAAGKKQA